MGNSAFASTWRIVPYRITTDNLCMVFAISIIELSSTESPCKTTDAFSTICGIPQRDAISNISAVSVIEVAFSKFSLNEKDVAIYTVYPCNAASTISISASGVHCNDHFSAQVAFS